MSANEAGVAFDLSDDLSAVVGDSSQNQVASAIDEVSTFAAEEFDDTSDGGSDSDGSDGVAEEVVLQGDDEGKGAPGIVTAGAFSTDAPSSDLETEPLLHAASCSCSACSGASADADVSAGDGELLSAASLGTLDDLADYLETDFWLDSGTSARHFNLAGTGTYAKAGEISYNTSGNALDADGLTNGRAGLVDEAFKVFEAVLGIDFQVSTASSTDFRFGDEGEGANASVTGSGGTVNYADINVASDWSGGSTSFGDYAFQTILHEIGHGLGLGHQGLYNGTGTYATDAEFTNDSWQASMMSYFDQTDNTSIDASFAFLSTPMVVDWIALDDLYGPQGYGVSNAFLGDTTYGFNTSISASTSAIYNELKDWIPSTAFSVVDGGGDDTIDFSGFANTQLIDLRPSVAAGTAIYASNVAGKIGNLTIASGTIIESAIGGSGDDTFRGNSADNNIDGGAGTDTLLVSGDLTDYQFIRSGSSLQLVDQRVGSPDGTDTLSNLEFVDFNGDSRAWSALWELIDSASPVVSGPSGDPGDATASIFINENSSTVATFTADETVRWSLMGGADQALFTINASSGALSFASVPDYEAPGDADADNSYVVLVRATDLAANSSDQTLTVQVLDLVESSVGSGIRGGGGLAPSGGGGGGGGGGGSAVTVPSPTDDPVKPLVFKPPAPRAASLAVSLSSFEAAVTFDVLTGQGADPEAVKQVGRLYTAAFGRSPDASGWFFWYEQQQSETLDWLTTAGLFLQSQEFSVLYGVDPSNAVFVEKLYANVLGRDADAGGYEYWLNLLDAEQLTKVDVLLSFADSVENIALFDSLLI